MAFRARWTGGKCSICGTLIAKGQEITWSRKGEKKLRHITCGTPETIETAQPIEEVTESEIEKEVNGKEENALLDLLADAMKSRLDGKLEAKLDKLLDISSIETLIDKKVKEYVLPTQTLKVSNGNKPVIVIKNAHKQLGLLVTILGKRRHIYLHGAPGGGKSKNAQIASESLGLRFGYISLDEQSPDYLVTGYMDAKGDYQESMFVNFYRNGGVFCIEEMDNASGSLLTALNCALENGHISLPNGELVARHKDFVLVSCGNTAGRGAHPAFPERRPFDAAFAARFFYIKWEYDWTQAYSIAAKINICSKPIVDWIKNASAFSEEQGIRVVFSPREAFLLADLISEESLTDDVLLEGIVRGLDKTSLEKILANYPFPHITRS